MLSVNNLTKRLPDGTCLLNGITFTVRKGEFVGILGASGAGKSLTMRCMLGLTSVTAGTVVFTSYAPKRIVLQAKADSSSVLLLNDKYEPNWKVSVDGKPAPLLRCNYLMRGVYLPPGAHTVEFSFAPSVDTLYVSLGAVLVSLLLIGYLALTSRSRLPNLRPL